MDLDGIRVGHVRLGGLLGKGGMGDVYEGFDEVLERRVAVKVLYRDPEMSDEAKIRFLREARALARLGHPNICQIHDCVEGPEHDFLVLELVEGATLTQARRRGLALEEKLRIALQVADVLKTAHAAGIVHRDLKPDNVMITPEGEVKVLDFGLARWLGGDATAQPAAEEARVGSGAPPDDAALAVTLRTPPPSGYLDAGVTRAGMIVGTLAYMSPEQANGASPTSACDLYSLGIVLQELLTERSAYPDGLGWLELLCVVQQGGTVPLEGVEADLAALIRALTSKEPAARPTAAEVAARLQEVLERPSRAARRRRNLLTAAAVSVLVAATALGTWQLARPRSLLAAGQQGRVALLPFVNATGDEGYAWVERGLVEMVAANAGQTSGVDVIAPEKVRRAMERFGLAHDSPLAEQDIHALAGALGAEIVAAARVEKDARGFKVKTTLHNVAGGGGRHEVSAHELTEAANAISERIVHRLRPSALAADIKDTFSADVFAGRAFAIGVDFAERGNHKRGRLYLEAAIDRDPAFRRARHRLVGCMIGMGELDQAATLATSLLEEARAQGERRLEANALSQLAEIALRRGGFAEARELRAATVAIARELGDQRLVAESLNFLGRTHLSQGELPAARPLFEQAAEAAAALGDRGGQANATLNLGFVLWRLGEWKQAEELFNKVLAFGRELRDLKTEMNALTNLGALTLNGRRYDEAREHFTAALARAEESGDHQAQGVIRNNLAAILFSTGKIAEAGTLYEANLAVFRSTGERPREAQALNNLSQVAATQGRLEEAEKLALEALALRRELGDRRGQALVLLALGQIEMKSTKGLRTSVARRRLQEALELSRTVGDREAEREASLLLARAAMYEGRLDRAAALITDAKRWQPDYPGTVLTEACLAHERGDRAHAIALGEKAKALSGEGWTAEDETALAAFRAGRRPRR